MSRVYQLQAAAKFNVQRVVVELGFLWFARAEEIKYAINDSERESRLKKSITDIEVT